MPKPGAMEREIIERARVIEKAGRPEEAEIILRHASAKHPEWAGLQWARAGILLALGRVQAYVSCLEKLVAAHPDFLEARLNLARTFIHQGAFHDARAHLSGLLETDPSNSEALFLEARLFNQTGQLEEAARAYERVLRLEPTRLETYFHLCETLQRLGRTREMFDTLRKARKLWPPPQPNDIKGWLGLFRLALCVCDYEEAARIGESVLDQTRDTEHLEVLRWPTFIDEFDLSYGTPEFHQEAMSALGALIAKRPESPWATYYRVLLCNNIQKLPRIELPNDLRRLRGYPPERYGWMRLETAKQSLYDNDFKAALEDFQLAVRSSVPGNWTAQCQAGEVLYCLGDFAAGERAFEAAEAMTPPFRRGNCLAWKGESYLWSGRYEEALACLDEAIKGVAQYAYCWKGGALVKLERFEEAAAVLEKAVALSPWDLEAKVWLCEARYRLGRYPEALEAISTDISGKGCSNFYVHALRGLICAAMGDAAGLEENFNLMPLKIAVYLTRRAGHDRMASENERVGSSLLSEDQMSAILESLLTWSRGVRRGDYERWVWMR